LGGGFLGRLGCWVLVGMMSGLQLQLQLEMMMTTGGGWECWFGTMYGRERDVVWDDGNDDDIDEDDG
jgi:hypothetical protein